MHQTNTHPCLVTMHIRMFVTLVVPIAMAVPTLSGATFRKTGHNEGSEWISVQGVGSGAFDPSRNSNWCADIRHPLIEPRQGGTCPGNIYAPTAVNFGDGRWRIYFGGWDGVSSCHDSVSTTATSDGFQTFTNHTGAIATGDMFHLNNPSASQLQSADEWGMLYTMLDSSKLNKPGYSSSSDGGQTWTPDRGESQYVGMRGYTNWTQADVNGANVLYFDEDANVLHMYFTDFAKLTAVFHALADAPSSSGAVPMFTLTGATVPEKLIVNDVKRANGHFLMGLHRNGPEVYVSYGGEPTNGTTPPGDGDWTATSTLFQHFDNADMHIVSVGFVVDSTGTRVLGALYGAGADASLTHNRIFARWLQRRVLFESTDNATTWGLGGAARARGPYSVDILTNGSGISGRFLLYDSDYVNATNRGTLLAVSATMEVMPGDEWAVTFDSEA